MISKSISHAAEFEIPRPAATVFPLFTPEGEKLWAPGWDYENLMGTDEVHEDDLFLTRNHDHAANDAIWIVKQFAPERFQVQYYKVEPGEKVGLIEVVCVPSASSSTVVRVTYRYSGLSDGMARSSTTRSMRVRSELSGASPFSPPRSARSPLRAS